jgi:hypothetical protein
MARLASVAVVVAALELLAVRRTFSTVYRWSTLRRDFPPGAGLLFAQPVGILVVQLAAGLALPWTSCAVVPWVAFASTLAISVRFRGSYNGGSDSMLLVVLLALALARTDVRLVPVALGYCAAQLVLSYAISGWAKLRDPKWRDGSALAVLVRLPQYAVPEPIGRVLSSARLASFAMLAFECAFPVALVDRRVCIAMLCIAGVFHVANAIVFGLNRFLWSWLAAFPALLFWVERLHA